MHSAQIVFLTHSTILRPKLVQFYLMLLTIVKYDEDHKFKLTSSHILLTSVFLSLSIIGIAYLLEVALSGILAIVIIGCVATPIFTML